MFMNFESRTELCSRSSHILTPKAHVSLRPGEPKSRLRVPMYRLDRRIGHAHIRQWRDYANEYVSNLNIFLQQSSKLTNKTAPSPPFVELACMLPRSLQGDACCLRKQVAAPALEYFNPHHRPDIV
jgi:hypothetical protein